MPEENRISPEPGDKGEAQRPLAQRIVHLQHLVKHAVEALRAYQDHRLLDEEINYLTAVRVESLDAYRDRILQWQSIPVSALEQLRSVQEELTMLAKTTDEQPELSQVTALMEGAAALHALFDKEAILARTLEVALGVAGGQWGSILRRPSSETAELDIEIIWSSGEAPHDPDGHIHLPVVNEVFDTGKGMIEGNWYENPEFDGLTPDMVAPAMFHILCTPLQQESESLSAIYLTKRLRWGLFRPRDLYLIKALARHVEVAIHNVQRWEQTHKG